MVLTHVDLIEKLLKYVASRERAQDRKDMDKRQAAKQRNAITSRTGANATT
jgi:hypothetical protein